jgi:prepilin peptidase CpaA
MASVLQLVALAGFIALMASAAIEDWRRLVIPNGLILGLLLLWPVRFATMPAATLVVGLEAAAAAVIVFACGCLLFSRGLVGGGDVKLFTAATLWVGAARFPTLLLLTGLLGGALSLLLLTPLGLRAAAAGRSLPQPRPAAAGGVWAAPVPYGAAIAGAALIVILLPVRG